MSLKGYTAFVTGGAGGLGRSICTGLAAAGAHVAIGYKSSAKQAEALAQELTETGLHAKAIPINMQDAQSIETAIAEAVAQFGSLDILVNNAGVAMAGHDVPPGDLEAFTPDIWDELMSVNIRGPYLASRAAAPHLTASQLGRIVNIGSTIGHGTWYADRAFHPSKAMMVPLTHFLAASLAPDVCVNCVNPGLMVGTGLGGPGGDYEAVWKEPALLNRTTSILDVAQQVVTLCQSEGITGQSIAVDGGINFT
ncbi:MAG: SDR family NAD(P)-dependent oxidoreductase [Pseudomonadota bacterium]